LRPLVTNIKIIGVDVKGHTVDSEVAQTAMADICARLTRVIEELQQSNLDIAELQRSNAELDRFAAIAAHDLRAPLTALAATVLAIQQEQVSPEVKELLEHAQLGILQMGNLMTRLLTYARVGHGTIRTMPCDSQTALMAAKESLKGVIESRGGSITGDYLPTVNADETLLAQLFQNLLENGLKYHGERPPRIHVRAERSQNQWLFTVADNGIGIPKDRLEDVFRPFTRLNLTKSEDAGTGLGLATCRRIVEQHKGRIWAESEAGKGTKILFTLPL